MHEVIKDVCITIPENNDSLVLDEKMRIGSKILDVILSDISADQLGEIDDVTKDIIQSSLNEIIANSLDVNSTRLRLRMKFDNNTSELVIALGDN
jgi:hypothetical protein